MLVRNTVSGVVVDLPAEKTLGHPWFGRFYVPADKPKNEVLSPPFEIDANGDRKAITTDTRTDTEREADEQAEAARKAIAEAEAEGLPPVKAPKPSDIKKSEAK